MMNSNNQEIKSKKKKRTRKIKPEDYLMTITTIIDYDLMMPNNHQNDGWVSQIQLNLNQMNIKYEIDRTPASAFIPNNTIKWKRSWIEFNQQFNNHECNEGKLPHNDDEYYENYLIYLMTAEDLINVITVAINSNTLTYQSPFKKIKDMWSMPTNGDDNKLLNNNNGKPLHITIFIYGLKEYFNSNNRNRINGNRNQNVNQLPDRLTIEQYLIKLQILENINYRLLETAADIGINVMQFSKSIAEIPYKTAESEKYSNQKFYLMNDNKNCVDVRNEIGLKNLWQHHLIKIPMVTLEIAEAIIDKYPMPKLLFNAYKLAGNRNGPDLLSNIPIRRGIGGGGGLGGCSGITGITSSIRKIGPELSRKIYLLYTNDDKNLIL